MKKHKNRAEYEEYVRQQTCIICGSMHPDPHHEPLKGQGGISDASAPDRASDYRTVPLCRLHHGCRHGALNKELAQEEFTEFMDMPWIDAKMMIIEKLKKICQHGVAITQLDFIREKYPDEFHGVLNEFHEDDLGIACEIDKYLKSKEN